MTTYPLNFPIVPISSERFQLNRRQAAMESPWTYAQQVVNTASQWVVEWTMPPMRQASAEALSAFFDSLAGQVGTFRYRPRQSQTSALTGRSLALSGFAYNSTIAVSGWGANAASQLRAGQYFQLGNQLLRVINAGAAANPSGVVTIAFEPALRVTFAAGTAVNFANPAGLFRLSSADGVSYAMNADKVCEFGAISAREAVE